MKYRKYILKQALEQAKLKGISTHGEFLVLYHGTSTSNLKKIIESGKFNSGTFFAVDHKTAMKYAMGLGSKPVVTMAILYAGALFSTTEYWTTNEELFQRNGTYQPNDLINANLNTG